MPAQDVHYHFDCLVSGSRLGGFHLDLGTGGLQCSALSMVETGLKALQILTGFYADVYIKLYRVLQGFYMMV